MAGALRQIQDFLTKTHDDALVKAKLPVAVVALFELFLSWLRHARRVRHGEQNVRGSEMLRDDVVDVFRVLRGVGVERRARRPTRHEGVRVRHEVL